MIVNTQGTLSMSANATTQNVALPNGGGLVLTVTNTGPQNAFIETSNDANSSAFVPTSSQGGGIPVLANQSVNMELRATDTRVAAVSSGNSTLYFTRGRTV